MVLSADDLSQKDPPNNRAGDDDRAHRAADQDGSENQIAHKPLTKPLPIDDKVREPDMTRPHAAG
jgi:hypothetical protein